MKVQFYIFLLSCLLPIILKAQSGSACGFDPDPATIQWINSHQEAIARFSADPAARNRLREAKRRVPIRFVSFNSVQTASLTQADVNQALNNLNNAFSPAGIEFFSCQAPLNIQSFAYANFFLGEETELLKEFEVKKVINVYCVESINNGSVSGYTYLPSINIANSDAIFMLKSHLGQPTFAHEMGHYYGLYHTHGKSNCETLTDELVNGADCDHTGDNVCDTPADPNLLGLGCYSSLVDSSSCTYIGTIKDSKGELFKPDVHNIMSYAPSECKFHFSPGQYDRIRYFAQFRIYPEECPSIQCNVPEIVGIDSTQNSIQIHWAALAQDSLYQIRYRRIGDTIWQIFNATSNKWTWANLQICTKLEVQLRRACGAGFSGWSSLRQLQTADCKDFYCSSYGRKSNHIWINRLKLSSKVFTSGNNHGYLLNPDQLLDLTNDRTYPLEIELLGKIRASDSLNLQIWVDKNLDDDFEDSGELVYRGTSAQKTLLKNPLWGGLLGPKSEESVRRFVHKGSFELPTDLQSGNSRMRVVLSLNKFAESPCDTSAAVLETEDYPIALRLNPTCAIPGPANISLKTITNTFAVFKAIGLNAAAYQWELRTYGGQRAYTSDNLSADSLYLRGLTENSRFEISVKILCKNGAYSDWSAPVPFVTLPIPCPAPDSSFLTVNNITHNSAQLVTGIQKEAIYHQFYYREKGTNNWIASDFFKANIATIEQLKANTIYEYRSRIYCSTTLTTGSTYSVIKNFITLPEPCKAPIQHLIQVQMIENGAMRFSYLDTSSYSAHQWRYRIQGNSSWKTLEQGVAILENPEPGTTFEIAVQGICATGISSDWSAAKTFITPCSAPRLNELSIKSLLDKQAKVVYRGSPRKGFYWQYKRFDETEWSTETYETDTLITVDNLEPLMAYHFRLRSLCASLEWSDYSASLTFVTTPVICALADDNQLNVTYASEQKMLAQCELSGISFSWRYRLLGGKSWIDSTETNSAKWLLEGLSFPADYEIQVKVQCAPGIWSEWATKLFSTPNLNCPAPSVNQIIWQLEQRSVYKLTLSSNTYQDLSWRIRKQGSSNWIMVADSLARKGIGVPDDEIWETSVRGECGEAGVSAWSESVELWGICQAAPLSSIQIKKIDPQQLEIECNVKSNGGFFWLYRAQGEPYWQGAETEQGTLVLPKLISETKYEIQVQRFCREDFESSFSEVLSFTTPALLCTPPEAWYLNADRITGHSAIVTYYLKKPGKYVLTYTVLGKNDWVNIAAIESQAFPEWKLGPLQANTYYSYRIGEYCDVDGRLVWSDSQIFQTLPGNFCPTPEPELIEFFYETLTRLRLDFPIFSGEQLSWRYRKTSDTTWTIGSSASSFVLELEPQQNYQVSVQKTCVDRLVSRWSAPASFSALCRLEPKDFEINKTSTGAWVAHCKIEGKGYEWAFRRQDQNEWEQRNWSASNQLNLEGLVPGTTYIIGLRVLCFGGDTTSWVQRTFNTQCKAISPVDIRVELPSLFSVYFECLNDAYRQYQWRLRSKTRVEEWGYVREDLQTLSYLRDSLYELQVRGLCLEDDQWSEWSESKLFTPLRCGLPDGVTFALQRSNRYELVAFSNTGLWHADRFKWQYRVFGQKEWIDLGYTDVNYLNLPPLLPGTRYEVALEMSCYQSSSKKTFFGEVVTDEDCFVPDLSKIQVQKISSKTADIRLSLTYFVQFEVRYRVKGSSDAYLLASGSTLNLLQLTQLNPGTAYEVMLRVICDKGSPWTEVFYFQTKACDIPYDGRIILSSISENSVQAYVELYDFNPIVTGISYTWQYKPARSSKWLQIPGQDGNTLVLQSLIADELYDLQVILQCKNNAQDTITFTTHFKAATSECSASPNLAWLDHDFDGPEKGFRIRCNLPLGYSISIRSWITDRNNVIQGYIGYLFPLGCSLSELSQKFDQNSLLHFQFRLICPEGNIGPWSEVITLDMLQGSREPAVRWSAQNLDRLLPVAKLIIWPNPNSGQFQLQLPDGVEGEALLSIFGADGRKITSKNTQIYDLAPLELDLSGQPGGLYFVKVLVGKTIFTERILLQNP